MKLYLVLRIDTSDMFVKNYVGDPELVEDIEALKREFNDPDWMYQPIPEVWEIDLESKTLKKIDLQDGEVVSINQIFRDIQVSL